MMNRARERLAFNEIFLTQLWLLKQRLNFKTQQAFAVPFEQELIQEFLAKLPFELTRDQKRSAWEIFQDIEKPKPMNRLLNGDVGSGKTVVAVLAALAAAKAGYQTAFMVPTEILALQHFRNLAELFKNQEVNIALSTSKTNKYFEYFEILAADADDSVFFSPGNIHVPGPLPVIIQPVNGIYELVHVDGNGRFYVASVAQ